MLRRLRRASPRAVPLAISCQFMMSLRPAILPALNVSGVLTVTSGDLTGEHQVLGSTIAAGDLLNARLVPPAAAIQPGTAISGTAHGVLWLMREGGVPEQCAVALLRTVFPYGIGMRSPSCPCPEPPHPPEPDAEGWLVRPGGRRLAVRVLCGRGTPSRVLVNADRRTERGVQAGRAGRQLRG